MLRRVQKYIRDNQLLIPKSRVLVCVSGGADSMALLDVLWRAGYQCVVAHCNFHLRGAESERDEQFVRKYVADKNASARKGDSLLELHIAEWDTSSYAREQGVSIELAARQLRYSWFARLAQEQGCTAIAVAHHQNDQAETLLMNLRRGAGIRGLAGMRPRSKNAQDPEGVPVVRPLLCTTHDYIVHYLRDIRHIEWVEDSSNSDTHFRRNAIRQELQSYSKAEIEHMSQTAEIMQGYVDWLEHQSSPQAQQVQLYEKTRKQ